MIIKSKLSEQDFINANFVLLYSRTMVKVLTGIFAFSFLVSVSTALFSSKVGISQIILPLIMILFLPVFTYFTAKKNYASNKRTSETIEYIFSNDQLTMTGESFNSTMSWNKIHKVSQTKNWVLIWQNSQIANPIPKRDIWEAEINSLKEILNLHHVKNNL